MLEEFDQDASERNKVSSPTSEKRYKVDYLSPTVEKEWRERFHSCLKSLYLMKRGRLEVMMAISFLCCRTREPSGSRLEEVGTCHEVSAANNQGCSESEC